MLQVYNDLKQRVALLDNVTDLCIERVLEYGDKTITFKYPNNASHAEDLKNEYYIRTKDDEYVIKSIADGEEINTYIAQLNIEELESKQFIYGYKSTEKTITECLTEVLNGTGWAVGVCSITKKRTIEKEESCTAWDLIKECVSTYRVEININSLDKIIDIYEQLGSDKGSYIMEGLNLKKLSRTKTTYDFFTVIIPIGKDGLEINIDGKNYIENHDYTSKKITRIWKDERYTNTESLIEDATAKVEEAAKPVEAYSVDIKDLAAQNEKYNIIDFDLGDVVTLVSKKNRIKIKQRIVKIKEYPKDIKSNSVELSTAKKTFSQIQKSAQEITKQQAIEAAKNIVSSSAASLATDDSNDYITREEFETFKESIEQRFLDLESG